jgi:transcriptional regulator with XRE-family HTH domain
LPTGRQIHAGRVLAGLHQTELARQARIDPSTLVRMEASGDEPVRGQGRNIQSVIDALTRNGVHLDEDGGVRPIPKPKGKR